MIAIDGSFGEGGGQILRTSLALAMVTGRAVRIENIRANRPKPGLMRQHLTALLAAGQVCDATIEGAEIGSSVVVFTPGEVCGGAYAFSIGTAGSTTLVLQTVLPALLLAETPSRVEVSGGTHNTHAPTVHFLRGAFLPLVRSMGACVDVSLDRHGFYPAGGGRITATIEPAGRLSPVELVERGEVVSREAVAMVAGLPRAIGERELAVVAERLGGAERGWSEGAMRVEEVADGVGVGNVVSIEVRSERVCEVFTGFGQRGVSAERVARGAADGVRRYLAAGVPVWRNLADQLMLPMALAGGGRFRTGPLSKHAVTNAEVIERFLDVRIRREELPRGVVEVVVDAG